MHVPTLHIFMVTIGCPGQVQSHLPCDVPLPVAAQRHYEPALFKQAYTEQNLRCSSWPMEATRPTCQAHGLNIQRHTATAPRFLSDCLQGRLVRFGFPPEVCAITLTRPKTKIVPGGTPRKHGPLRGSLSKCRLAARGVHYTIL